MELLLLLLCFLTLSVKTFGDETSPDKIIIKEDEDVILNCSFSTTLTDKTIDWKKDDKGVFFLENGQANPSSQDQQFRDRVSHFPDELKSGNASIKIKKAKVSDSGTYNCLYLPQGAIIPSQLHHVVVIVEYILKDRTGEETNGSIAKPSAKTVFQTDDWALVRCQVLGASPEPSIVWYDNVGNNITNKVPHVSEKGDNVTLETTVKNTDYYTCVATQKELHHQLKDTIFVHFGGKGSGTPGWVLITVGIVIGVAGAFATFFLFKHCCKRNSSEGQDDNRPQEGDTEDLHPLKQNQREIRK